MRLAIGIVLALLAGCTVQRLVLVEVALPTDASRHAEVNARNCRTQPARTGEQAGDPMEIIEEWIENEAALEN